MCRESAPADPVEHAEVVVPHRLRFGAAGHLLAELGQDRAEPALAELGGCIEGGVERLAGEKASHGALKEGAIAQLAGEPLAARGSQQDAAGETHGAIVYTSLASGVSFHHMTRQTALVAAMLTGACARPSGAPPAPPAPAPAAAPAAAGAACLLDAGRGGRGPTVTVALTDSVDPVHVPVPRNDAERLVFGQLYETLVRVDCEGHAVPGLAASWSSSDGGRRWTLTLRDQAQFWDGAPVTARDVVVGKSGAGFTLNGGRRAGARYRRRPLVPRRSRARGHEARPRSRLAHRNGAVLGDGRDRHRPGDPGAQLDR